MLVSLWLVEARIVLWDTEVINFYGIIKITKIKI